MPFTVCERKERMELHDFFEKYDEVAVAFSGGVDSSYLLCMAKKYAKKVRAYYVKSEFQPEFELEDGMKLSQYLEVEMKVIYLQSLKDEKVAENPSNRCYYCKKIIFQRIIEEAKTDGFTIILDGTNASDDASDRPGMKALEEMKILSPLRLCDLTKEEIRERSKAEGLFTWNKPAYACLATRIPTGEMITKEKLKAVEKAETFLFSLGFSDFRVRVRKETAVLQLRLCDWQLLMKNRKKIWKELKKYYAAVVLDLEVRDE